MAAPSPAGPAGPGVPVVPRVPPAAPSTPGGPPGASCLMRSGVASMICRASVTTSAWGWGTLGLSCPKDVPDPGCSPPLPAGCRRAGPGHPQGGWGALVPPSCHPQRDQGAAGQSQDPPRAPMGMTGCWLCSALGTSGTRQGGLVLERHTPRGKGGHAGRGKRTGDTTGTHGGHKEAEEDREQGGHGDAQGAQGWGERTWRGTLGQLGIQRCWGRTGDMGGHSRERLEGTSDTLGAHKRGQGGNTATVTAVRSSEGAVTGWWW